MFTQKSVRLILMVALGIMAIVMFRSAAFYLIPLFILVFLILSQMNRGSNWKAEEDPADWWKKGDGKKEWDI